MSPSELSSVSRVEIPRQIVAYTLEALQVFGAHESEGLILWLGEIEDAIARVVYAFPPPQESISTEDGLGYFVTGDTLYQLNRTLAETGLRLIAQVHSHPGRAYHSDTDDRYAIVTAEGGISLVVPNFGRVLPDLTLWAVYRLVGRKWQHVHEIASLLTITDNET
jgi:proteasome lid subunit RPN8/RPN11